MINFEAEWQKLKKIENRARKIAYLRDTNEIKWDKLHQKLSKYPEFDKKCNELGIARDYNYGDIIC